MEGDQDRGIGPFDSLRDENEWYRSEVTRLRLELAELKRRVPRMHTQESFDMYSVMISYTLAVSMKDIIALSREDLVGSIMEKFRAGIVREVNQLERKHHEGTKQDRTGGTDRGVGSRSDDRGNDVTG